MNNVRPRVVIVGAGFGGLNAALELARAPVDVIVVDRRNHHLFQPLLYQVATATLSPADVAAPIRKVLRKQANTRVILGEVSAVRLAERCIVVDGHELGYDVLVLAAGASHSYFGHPEWERVAPGLKTIEDATEIRRRFLTAFEAAENTDDPKEREAQLTFVVVGGGPTGVELAGSMAEIAHTVLPGDFRRSDPRRARVLLVEGQARVLSAMPEECSRRALEQLEQIGVEVRTGVHVTEIDERGVVAGGERIEARTVLWAAGVQASPLGATLTNDTNRVESSTHVETSQRVEVDKQGRVVVLPDLSIPGDRDVFVIGDQARAADPVTQKLVPGVAQGAIQMGRFVGRTIAREAASAARNEDRPERGAFFYYDKGDLATIGRSRAVANIRGRQLSGFVAWVVWALVHVAFLIRFRNRVSVMLSWVWSYVFFDRGARLITGSRSPRH